MKIFKNIARNRAKRRRHMHAHIHTRPSERVLWQQSRGKQGTVKNFNQIDLSQLQTLQQPTESDENLLQTVKQQCAL